MDVVTKCPEQSPKSHEQNKAMKDTFIRTYSFILKNFGIRPIGITSAKLPHVEEGLPINEINNIIEIVVIEYLDT